MSNTVDPDETAHMSRLIWIYAVFKNLLLSSVAVKGLKRYKITRDVSLSSKWTKEIKSVDIVQVVLWV